MSSSKPFTDNLQVKQGKWHPGLQSSGFITKKANKENEEKKSPDINLWGMSYDWCVLYLSEEMKRSV